MILSKYKDFPSSGRILGLDWGSHRCGIAISNENRDLVFSRPQINITNQDMLLEYIVKFIQEEQISGVVIGLPLYADGSDSETTKNVRKFADVLAMTTDTPIIFVEENLTSCVAQDLLLEKKCKNIKSILDSESARIILENAISILKRI